MKETRFIELLNLYVDQQLSGLEAAELEAEIQSNPARHRTYREYCRMQKGCAQLFEYERSAAPASAKLSRALTEADRKILAFPVAPSRRVLARGYGFAALAAAACVAFVVMRQPKPPASATVTSIGSTEHAPTVVATPATVVAMDMGSKPGFSAALAEPAFRTLTVSSTDGVFFNERASPAAASLVWMQDVQLKPIRKVSSDEFLFRKSSPKDADEAVLPVYNSEDSTEESAAFTFTK